MLLLLATKRVRFSRARVFIGLDFWGGQLCRFYFFSLNSSSIFVVFGFVKSSEHALLANTCREREA